MPSTSSATSAPRVIVQTAEQVKAVQMFIEANFTVLQKDDKGLAPSESTFGYRDMHYLVQLPPEGDATFGITPAERQAIGSRRAAFQVRTWLQHAWADTSTTASTRTNWGSPPSSSGPAPAGRVDGSGRSVDERTGRRA